MLRRDPVKPLLAAGNPAIAYLTRRDVLDEEDELDPVQDALWTLPEVETLVGRQRSDGSWKYPGAEGKGHVRAQEDYDQLETYRQLGVLVEKYGMTREHPAIEAAAQWLFSHQADEGDFRGIYGAQYSPNYSAAITELLVKAGYATDERVTRQMTWLLSMRQADGGWAIPFRSAGDKLRWTDVLQAETILPDRTRPFSHLVTGVVLRAFAAHPKYRKRREARAAGNLLASRFFRSDKYPDRRAKDYWTKFAFPFWFTDLLSALDSLHGLGITAHDPAAGPQITGALEWFVERQSEDGLWDLELLKKAPDHRSWNCYVVARTLHKFF